MCLYLLHPLITNFLLATDIDDMITDHNKYMSYDIGTSFL